MSFLSSPSTRSSLINSSTNSFNSPTNLSNSMSTLNLRPNIPKVINLNNSNTSNLYPHQQSQQPQQSQQSQQPFQEEMFPPDENVIHNFCTKDEECPDGSCDPDGICNQDESDTDDEEEEVETDSEEDIDDCDDEYKVKRNENCKTKKWKSSKKVMDVTLGTSQQGLELSTACWKTLNFENIHKQITYPMNIMKHVFVYLVKHKPIFVTGIQDGHIRGNYSKLTDSEMNIILNPTDKHVHIVNIEKKLIDMLASFITPFHVNENVQLGIEFSGEGRRIFGHSTKSITNILQDYANQNQNKNKAGKYLFDMFNELNNNTYKYNVYDEQIVTHDKNDFLLNFNDQTGAMNIKCPVDFEFGTMNDQNGYYIIDEKYSNLKDPMITKKNGLKEKPIKIVLRLNLQFHIHSVNDPELGVIKLGFNPLEYTVELTKV
jgi:hypothetical protein